MLGRKTLALAALTLTLPAFAAAQTATGVVDGVISDPNGLRVPGVTVVANSPALIQQDLTVFSDAQGYYRLPLLPPGRYEVTYSLQGFQTLERTGLIVTADQTTTANADLVLASVQETTTVVGESPTLDQRGAKVAFSYNEDVVEHLPTGRNLHRLLDSIPGVDTTTNFANFQRPATSTYQSVLGNGERSSSYWMDGANTTDPAGQWNIQGVFPYDIIEEVQVLKAAKPAEAPFQGGLIHVITKSGGNDFHGTLGTYFFDDAFESDNGAALREELGINTSNKVKEDYEVTASMGGRFIPNKLWWYGAVRRQAGTSTLFGFPTDIEDTINSVFWKNTYQVNEDHRLSGFVSHYDKYISHYFFSLDPLYSPANAKDEFAATVRPLTGTTGSVRWDAILGNNVIAEATFSRTLQEWTQEDRPGSGVAIIDLVTGDRTQASGEGTRDQDTEDWSVSGSLSWFVPDAAGRHDIKAGFEYFPTRMSIVFDDFQNHRLNTVFGNARIVRFLSTPSHGIWDNDLTSAYIQDSWTIQDRLTLNFGLRFDHTTASTPAQETGGGFFANTPIADRFPALNAQTLPPTDLVNWSNVAPRFAGTYSFDEAGKTILRFGASRYYHNLSSFGLFVSNPAFPFTFATGWTDRNGDSAFQIGEEGFLFFQFGGQINPVDPNLKRPYTNEFVVGVSHELFEDTQVSVNAYYRKEKDLTATLDTGVPTDQAFSPVQVSDPGADGIAGTGDDATFTAFARDLATVGDSIFTLSNPAGNERTYKGLEIVASKRFSNRWQGVASVIVSENEVVQPTIQNAIANLFDNPNGLINAKGLDPNNETVQVKLQGTYTAPWDVYLSASYKYGSGRHFTRQLSVELPQGPTDVFAEPRGSSTTDDTNNLDIRVEKQFSFDPGYRLGVILDVFNVTNSAAVTNYGKRTGIDYNTARSIVFPRIARFGLRFTW